MPLQSLVYPQNQFQFSYPTPMISQPQPLNRYARFDSRPVALTQSSGQAQQNQQDTLLSDTSLPSKTPQSGSSKRFGFFD